MLIGGGKTTTGLVATSILFMVISSYITNGQDCIKAEEEIACPYALYLTSNNAKDCQILCKSFSTCIIFNYNAETQICSLCRYPGVHITNKKSVWGPFDCSASERSDNNPGFPEDCIVDMRIDDELLVGFPVFEGVKTFFECQNRCNSKDDCAFAIYNGRSCVALSAAFKYLENGNGLLFGLQSGTVVLGKACTAKQSSACLRLGLAYRLNASTKQEFKIYTTTTLDDCVMYMNSSEGKYNVYSFWDSAHLCIVTQATESITDADATAVFSSIDPFRSALTLVSPCRTLDVGAQACIQAGGATCDAYDFLNVISYDTCAVMCRELIACQQFVYDRDTKRCRLCWNVVRQEHPSGNAQLTGTRVCLLEKVDFSNQTSFIAPTVFCCPLGLPHWCASPFKFYNTFPPLAILDQRTPFECHLACNRIQRCKFALYEGSQCKLYEVVNNLGGVYLDEGADSLVISKSCSMDMPHITGSKLITPNEDLQDYIYADSLATCRDNARMARKSFSTPFEKCLYWPAHGLCVFSRFHITDQSLSISHIGVFEAPLDVGLPLWAIILIAVLSTVATAAFSFILWRYCRSKRASKKVKKLERSLGQSSWLEMEVRRTSASKLSEKEAIPSVARHRHSSCDNNSKISVVDKEPERAETDHFEEALKEEQKRTKNIKHF